MSLDSHLIHTCTINNPIGGTVNAYNNESKAFDAPVSGVNCRLVEKQEKSWSNERQESVVQTVYMLMVNRDVTINERAEITEVVLDSTTTLTDKFIVTEVLLRNGRGRHHKTAKLERIS